jgi:hypothetical protein
MMPFTVEWDKDPEDELARIYMQASDPMAVTQAQARADKLLAANPTGNGQLLSEGLYRINVRPLVVNYTLDPARRHVQVTWVRYSP